MSWLPPTNAIVSGYILSYTLPCGEYNGRLIRNASQNSAVITQLLPGKELLLSIQATNSLGLGMRLNIVAAPYGESE